MVSSKFNNNILLISFFFAPENIVGAKRFSYLSGYLVKQGLIPHILTIKEKYILHKNNLISPQGLVYRTSLIYNYYFRNRKLNRLLRILSPIDVYSGWILPGLLKAFFIIKKYRINTVLVTGLPFSSFLIPFLLSHIFKFRLIIDYRDPWILYERKGGIKKDIIWWIEKKILRRAGHIIFNTEYTKEKYLELLPEIGVKSSVISNGFAAVKNSEIKKLESKKKTIVYAGNFYGGRSIIALAKEVHKLNNQGYCIAIHIFGTIHPSDRLKLEEEKLPADLIAEHEKVNFQVLQKYLLGADILFVTQGKDHEYSVPYKLIEYFPVRKPILAITSKNSATHRIINETDSGETAFEDDPDSVYNAVKKILSAPESYTFKNIDNYSFENVGSRFLELLNSSEETVEN